MTIQVGALYKFRNHYANGPEWIYAFPIGKIGSDHKPVYIQYLPLGENMLEKGCYAITEEVAYNMWVRVS
jgi:hypothetical protein